MTDEGTPPGKRDAEGPNGEAERPARPGEGGFELESLREDVEKRLNRPPLSPPPPPPPPPPAPASDDPAREAAPEPPSWREDDDEVDRRTVAERRGQQIELHAGRRPPPPDWPQEALTFPLRGDRVGLGMAVGVWVLLDLVGLWGNLFVGTLLKILAYLLFLRWQLSVAATSASGQDVPTSFARVADIDKDALKALGRLIAIFALLALPAVAFLLLDKTAAGLFLLVAGLLWAGVAALGAVVGEPSLVLPWKAFPWMAARPLGLLAGTLGWVAAVGIEWLEGALGDLGVFPALVLVLVVRVAFVYLWLLSARALGVVGRAWSPFVEDDAAPTESA